MDKKTEIERNEMWDQIKKYGKEILISTNHKSTKNDIQHGVTTVRRHMIQVAMCSLWLDYRLHLHCSKRELVRGALLHDYFLYDWHSPEHCGIKNLHGIYHPGIAYNNAKKEYVLSEKERDIIVKHMWPLTFVPPKYREAWLVSMADKICSFKETINRREKIKRIQNAKRKCR